MAARQQTSDAAAPRRLGAETQGIVPLGRSDAAAGKVKTFRVDLSGAGKVRAFRWAGGTMEGPGLGLPEAPQ